MRNTVCVVIVVIFALVALSHARPRRMKTGTVSSAHPGQQQLKFADAARVNSTLRIAKNNAAKGRVQDAIKKVTRLLQQYDKQNLCLAAVLGTRAKFYLDVGYRDKALVDLNKAIGCDQTGVSKHDQASNLHMRGSIHVGDEHWQWAMIDFQAATKVEPGHYDHWLMLGRAQKERGEFNRARDALLTAIELNPLEPSAWEWLGRTYLFAANVSDALEAYAEAARLKPGDCQIEQYYAQTYQRKGDAKTALDHLSICMNNCPQEDMHDIRHLAGVSLTYMGQYKDALSQHDEAMRLNQDRYIGENFFFRQYAQFLHNHLDMKFTEYNIDLEMNPAFMNSWSNKLGRTECERQPAYIPAPPYDHLIPDVNPRSIFPLNHYGQIGGDAGLLLEYADRFVPFLQLDSPGFFPNVRQLRAMSLVIVDIAQQVRAYWSAPAGKKPKVPFYASSGGCSGGFGRSSDLCEKDENGVELPHEYGWRDLFDIAVKWRQVAAPEEVVLWNDHAFAFRTDAELMTQAYATTEMIDNEYKNSRYFIYFKKVFARFRKLLPEQVFGNDDPKFKRVKAMIPKTRNLDQLRAVVPDDATYMLVVMPVNSPTRQGHSFMGTKVTYNWNDPGYTFTIKTSRQRDRSVEYEIEMRELWRRICVEGNKREGTRDLKKMTRLIITFTHIWFNFMGLNRGTAGSGYAVMQALMLAAGITTEERVPRNIQMDWEALLAEDTDPYVDWVIKWMFPEGIPTAAEALDVVQELDALPKATNTFPTMRHVVAILDLVVTAMPIDFSGLPYPYG